MWVSSAVVRIAVPRVRADNGPHTRQVIPKEIGWTDGMTARAERRRRIPATASVIAPRAGSLTSSGGIVQQLIHDAVLPSAGDLEVRRCHAEADEVVAGQHALGPDVV